MHIELSIALNFIISYLYNKLPRRRVDMFCEELEKGLRKKFEGHWYPEEPFKGSGFRSIKLNNGKVDHVLDLAAQLSGLSVGEILEYLPKALTLWIDPNEVSYRIGENGPVKILYHNRRSSAEEFVLEKPGDNDATSHGFNPRAESFLPPEQHLPATLSGLSLSPSSNGSWVGGSNGSTSPSSGTSSSTSPVGSFRPRPSSSTCFTAAAFAQTKFGSTKMKTQAQRPTRLSPTELGGGPFPSAGSKHSPISPLGQASLWASLGNPCLASPTSNVNLIQLSPMQTFPQFIGLRDSRMEMLKEQQQQQQCLLLLQQQQQQKMRLNGSLLPNQSSSMSSDVLTKSLTSPSGFYDNHHQQQQPSLFLQSSPTTTAGHRSLSPGQVSMATASDCLAPPQQQRHDVVQRSRDDATTTMANCNFLQDNRNNVNQLTTADDVDWSALINPYANVNHLLVAN